jgi:(E)-4-hydroxy-3-methylbut-2-enyl-diphosphate synthase
MEIKRKKTRVILLRDVFIGGGAPVSIQTMTKMPTRDVPAVLREIKKLKQAGCDIVRLAVLNREDALSLGKITTGSPLPVVADIHFSRELSLEAIRQGVDGIRINPGNIVNKSDWKLIAKELKKRKTVLRIGGNSGSIPHKTKYEGMPTSEKLVDSVMEAVSFFENEGVERIKISLKASDVLETVEAYEMVSGQTRWPLHVGVTASGVGDAGIVKTTLGIGSLLMKGIGDTIRVSLNDTSLREVSIARWILQSLNIRRFGLEIMACPGCGRSQIDILRLARAVQQRLKGVKKDLKVAVMGCIVNGPGEAKEADIGIAGGKGEAIVFKKGKVMGRAKERDIVGLLVKEVEGMD